MKTSKDIWQSIRLATPKNGEWVVARFAIGSLAKRPQIFQWDEERDRIAVEKTPDLHWMRVPVLDAKETEDDEASINEHAESPREFSDDSLPSKLSSAKKRESRRARWERAASDACTALYELKEVQEEFAEWKDNLPENLADSTLGNKLDEVCELDIDSAIDVVEEAQNADLPLGFGRD